MSKAWCIWCENGDRKSPSGYYWIHLKCAEELMDVKSDLKHIREMLEGTHNRNKKTKDRIECVVKFLDDMEDFKRRWDNTQKLIKQLSLPLAPKVASIREAIL